MHLGMAGEALRQPREYAVERPGQADAEHAVDEPAIAVERRRRRGQDRNAGRAGFGERQRASSGFTSTGMQTSTAMPARSRRVATTSASPPLFPGPATTQTGRGASADPPGAIRSSRKCAAASPARAISVCGGRAAAAWISRTRTPATSSSGSAQSCVESKVGGVPETDWTDEGGWRGMVGAGQEETQPASISPAARRIPRDDGAPCAGRQARRQRQQRRGEAPGRWKSVQSAGEPLRPQGRQGFGRHVRYGTGNEIGDHFSRPARDAPASRTMPDIDEQAWMQRVAERRQAVGRQQFQALPRQRGGDFRRAWNPVVGCLTQQRERFFGQRRGERFFPFAPEVATPRRRRCAAAGGSA